MKIFDERLTQLRKEKGISQKECAESLKIEPSKYNKWENGKNCPDFETVCQLAKYFNVTTDYLLGASECRSAENDDINKRLGLSEEAIAKIISISSDVVCTYKPCEYMEPVKLIDVLNMLIQSSSFEDYLHDLLRFILDTMKIKHVIPSEIKRTFGSIYDEANAYYPNEFSEILDEISKMGYHIVNSEEYHSLLKTQLDIEYEQLTYGVSKQIEKKCDEQFDMMYSLKCDKD